MMDLEQMHVLIKKSFKGKKRSRWFTIQKPPHNGWYEVRETNRRGGIYLHTRYFFNGCWYFREVDCNDMAYRSYEQNWQWRGLSEQAK